MLAQIRAVLDEIEEPGSDAEVIESEPESGPEPASVTETESATESEPAPETDANTRTHRGPAGARERLRLARVVLEAGFAADAARAAHDALARAIAGLLGAPPSEPGHRPLMAAAYRELLPVGRLPVAALAAFAMLHDLSSLDAHGVPVGVELAAQAVSEAEHWSSGSAPPPSELARPTATTPAPREGASSTADLLSCFAVFRRIHRSG